MVVEAVHNHRGTLWRLFRLTIVKFTSYYGMKQNELWDLLLLWDNHNDNKTIVNVIAMVNDAQFMEELTRVKSDH